MTLARLLLATALLTTLPLWPAAAQTLDLTLEDEAGTEAAPEPREDEEDGGAPLSLLPRPRSDGAAAPAVGEDSLVEVAPLTGAAPERTGSLTAEGLGLPEDLWAGSNGVRIAALLDRLAAEPELRFTPALWQLLGDLMLVSAAEPGAPAAGGSLLARRATVLQRLGRHEDIAALAEAAPEALQREPVARGWMDRRLLAGDAEDFCGDLPPLLKRFDTPYWRRLDLYCRAAGGEFEAVSQGLSLLREENRADALQDALLARGEAEADSGLPPEELQALLASRAAPAVTPLDLLLVANAGLAFPEAWAASPDPAIAAAVADALPGTSIPRLEAAERLAVLGLVGPEALQAAYAAYPTKPEDLAAALQPPPDRPAALQRALLVQALVQEPNPLVQAELFGGLVSKLPPQGNAGILLQQLGAGLPPQPGLSFLAPDMARLLLLQGPDPYILRPSLAARWLPLLAADRAAEPATALVSLLRLVRLDSEAPEAPPAENAVAMARGLTAWLAEGPGRAEDKRRLLQIAQLLVPHNSAPAQQIDALQTALPDTPLSLDTAALDGLAGLEAAEHRGAVGEVLLRGTLLLASAPSGDEADALTVVVASSWQRLGLEDRARALLEEALIERLHALRFAPAVASVPAPATNP